MNIRMRQFLWISVLCLSFCQLGVYAQPTIGTWSEGKTGGIYLSRKEFSYSMEWLQMLNQFTRLGGDDIPREDLKLATLVRLGQLLEASLTSVVPESSWIFMNESPSLSNTWMRIRSATDVPTSDLKSMPDSIDFIVNVESLLLSAYAEKSVYSQSNRIHTDRRLVYTGTAQIRITDRNNKNVMAPIVLRVNSDLDAMDLGILDFDNQTSPGGQYLSVLFSQLLTQAVR